jgi:hypothetical protein
MSLHNDNWKITFGKSILKNHGRIGPRQKCADIEKYLKEGFWNKTEQIDRMFPYS